MRVSNFGVLLVQTVGGLLKSHCGALNRLHFWRWLPHLVAIVLGWAVGSIIVVIAIFPAFLLLLPLCPVLFGPVAVPTLLGLLQRTVTMDFCVTLSYWLIFSAFR